MLRKTTRGMLSVFGGSSMHKRKWTDETIADWEKKRESGMTYRAIGAERGVSGSSVRSALIKHGTKPIHDNMTVPKGYISIKDYCDKYGYTYGAVYHYVHLNSIEFIKISRNVYIKEDSEIKRRTIEDMKIEAILILREGGMTQADIANVLGLNRNTVVTYLNMFKED